MRVACRLDWSLQGSTLWARQTAGSRPQRPIERTSIIPSLSSTTDLTPDDWRVIRLALQRAIVEHTAANRWPAAEAAQLTLAKVPHP